MKKVALVLAAIVALSVNCSDDTTTNIREKETFPLLVFTVEDRDSVVIAPGDTAGPVEVSANASEKFCWTVLPGDIPVRDAWGYRWDWGDDGTWDTDWTPFVRDLTACAVFPALSGRNVLSIGVTTSVGEFYYYVEVVFV